MGVQVPSPKRFLIFVALAILALLGAIVAIGIV
jgi:hypothetical protein